MFTEVQAYPTQYSHPYPPCYPPSHPPSHPYPSYPSYTSYNPNPNPTWNLPYPPPDFRICIIPNPVETVPLEACTQDSIQEANVLKDEAVSNAISPDHHAMDEASRDANKDKNDANKDKNDAVDKQEGGVDGGEIPTTQDRVEDKTNEGEATEDGNASANDVSHDEQVANCLLYTSPSPRDS